jgi:hypothetical protein
MGRDHGRTGAPHHHAGRRPPPDLAVEIFAADRRWRETLQEFFRGHDAIGTGDAFAKGRDFAAWLGLVPKRISTGDRYLRVLFVQAAWVVLIKPQSWEHHGLKRWLEAAKRRLHRNVLAIALANKLARIAWSVLSRGRTFEASALQAACCPKSGPEAGRRQVATWVTLRWTMGL